MQRNRPFTEMMDRAYWARVWALGMNAFKMRDQGTFFGFFWTLLNPLIYFLVLYNLFVKWMGSKVPEFPLYLIIGIVQWNFFSGATSNAIGAIIGNANMILSMSFRKSVLVLASVLSMLLAHLVELCVLLFVVALAKGTFHAGWIAIIPLVLLTIYLVVSLSFILATVGVYFLDVNRIWALGMSIGFFLTPIFYPMDVISADKRIIILANPMTHIIQATRAILIDNRWPDLIGLGYVFLFSSVALWIGYVVFNRQEGYFVEHLYE